MVKIDKTDVGQCFLQDDHFDTSIEQPIKLTTMKHLFFCGCTLIILIFISCKKDSVKEEHSVCPNCKVIDSSTALSSQIIYINDSNWAQQGQYIFKSDLTQLINAAGASVSEVYLLQLVDENDLLQIFPCCQVNFKGGELSGSVYSTGNEKTCTLTFSYSDQDMHFGEFRNSGGLPFQSTEIKVWLWK